MSKYKTSGIQAGSAWINATFTPTTPEQEAAAVRVLRQFEVLDLIPVLGLSLCPEVTPASSSGDSKLLV